MSRKMGASFFAFSSPSLIVILLDGIAAQSGS